MTKSELVEVLAVQKGITVHAADRLINAIFEGMTETLIAGGRVEVRGFGTFENREYDGRKGRNPKTGETVAVTAKKRPFFKVGKELKERISA